MNTVLIGILGIVIMILLIFAGMNIGCSMALVGFVGYWMLRGWSGAFGLLKTVPFTNAMNYTLCVMPLFILMGQLAFHSGLSTGLFNAADKWLGGLRGGLAMATIAACAFFAAICGSTAATAATMGVVALPEMRKFNYSDTLATGSICAGGTLGILIPPSTAFIIYGLMAEESIGQLFAAGILPGIVLALCYIITTSIRVRINPTSAPNTMKYTWKERFVSLKGVISVVILFIAVLGGMFSGLFTATEAAAIGAFICLIFMIIGRKFTFKTFWTCLEETLKTTAMCFLVIVSAMIFGYFLAITRVPTTLAAWVCGLAVPRLVILIAIIIVYLILGCIMDTLPMVLITVPIVLPMIKDLGYDPVWFGVMIVMVMECGLITPPIGMNVWIVGSVAKDVPMQTIFKGALPYVGSLLVAISILIAVPKLALWLPGLLY